MFLCISVAFRNMPNEITITHTFKLMNINVPTINSVFFMVNSIDLYSQQCNLLLNPHCYELKQHAQWSKLEKVTLIVELVP